MALDQREIKTEPRFSQVLLDPIEPRGAFGAAKEIQVIFWKYCLSLCLEPGPAQQHRHSTRTLLTPSGFGAESLNISP